MANLALHLIRTAQERPDAVAVILDDERLTYRDLDALTSRMAGWLRGQGVGPGDRVALMLPNLPTFPVVGIGDRGGQSAPPVPRAPTVGSVRSPIVGRPRPLPPSALTCEEPSSGKMRWSTATPSPGLTVGIGRLEEPRSLAHAHG